MRRNKKADRTDWSEEAWQNWIGFWNLILQEYIKQNPKEYKKLVEKEKLKVIKNKKS